MGHVKSSEFSVGISHPDKDQQNKDLCSSLYTLFVSAGPWTPHCHQATPMQPITIQLLSLISLRPCSLHPHSPLTGPDHHCFLTQDAIASRLVSALPPGPSPALCSTRQPEGSAKGSGLFLA